MKLDFQKTSHNTIRVWMYFEKSDRPYIMRSKEYDLFNMLSIWNGADKQDKGMFSWELPKTLKDWIVDKYSFNKNCIVDL